MANLWQTTSKKRKLSSKALASSLIPNIFWQSFGKLPPAGKVLCQSIAISGNDRQSLAAQYFFAATMPLPCGDITAQILFHKGLHPMEQTASQT